MAKDTRPIDQGDTSATAKKRRIAKGNASAEGTSQPNTPEVDLYNEVVTFEEMEAKERNAEKDVKLYLQICDEIKSLLIEIGQLKTKPSEETASLVKEKQFEISLKIIMLKKLNRLEKVRMKESRVALQLAREQVDSDHLQLQNMLYEVLHLTKEVKKCLEFKSKDEEMDLVPVDEFYANAPESISKPEVTKKNDHELKLARLQWELVQRKDLAAQCKKLEANKESVAKDIEAKKEQLNNLAPLLKSVLDATKPLQENLGMPLEKAKKLSDLVYLLPKPLYVLYVQADAYSQVVKWISVTINGECDKTPTEELHLDDISSDDSDSDDADVSHRRKINFQDRKKSGGGSNTRDRVEQKKNECIKKHQLSVILKITLKTKEVLVIEFQWLTMLEVICVLPTISLNESLGIAADDLLSSRNILSSLFPGDNGETCPNSSAYYQLRRAGLDSFPSGSNSFGIPYRWAQEVCGIDLLPPTPEIRFSLSQKTLESTMKIIRHRFRNRLSLARQILRLETGFTITHKKMLSTLTSFVTISLEEFSKLPTAQQVLNDNIVDGSFLFYKATLQVNPAKLYAYIAVSPNYPSQYPLILVEFVYKGNTYNALNSNGLRDLEKEFNVYAEDPAEENKDEGTLLRQMTKLFHSVEIFAHVELSNEVNVQATYFRPIQGRSRSYPYKYISSGGGIYIQR
ncbi:hypothetical protein RUM44_003470 [Polyplax serrata]|uniref:THO complex subunit 5 n=1 Tax=Polyplax serrata TaxID=468196 RepID=A0ABR1AGI2_POLSC